MLRHGHFPTSSLCLAKPDVDDQYDGGNQFEESRDDEQ